MFRKLILFLIYITVPTAAAIVTYAGLQFAFLLPVASAPADPVVFEIPEQSTFSGIARQLQDKGLVRFSWAIKLLAKFKGQDTSVQAGEYELSASMTPAQILEKLAAGKMILRRITVREGLSVWDIGVLLEQSGILPRIEFEQALTDNNLLHELGVSSSSFEGYLFPETYQFPRGSKPKKILTAMLDQLQKVWTPEWSDRLALLKMSKHQLLTLASIIEKETGAVDEQPIIASVFHNRLNRGMKLQADPTVIYGIPNFSGNLTKEDLTTFTPYNTYVIEGLPPTPIGNPGVTAIKAALYPASTEYLYFVADGQGRHVFSVSLNEHNSAVNTYQRNGGPPTLPTKR